MADRDFYVCVACLLACAVFFVASLVFLAGIAVRTRALPAQREDEAPIRVRGKNRAPVHAHHRLEFTYLTAALVCCMVVTLCVQYVAQVGNVRPEFNWKYTYSMMPVFGESDDHPRLLKMPVLGIQLTYLLLVAYGIATHVLFSLLLFVRGRHDRFVRRTADSRMAAAGQALDIRPGAASTVLFVVFMSLLFIAAVKAILHFLIRLPFALLPFIESAVVWLVMKGVSKLQRIAARVFGPPGSVLFSRKYTEVLGLAAAFAPIASFNMSVAFAVSSKSDGGDFLDHVDGWYTSTLLFTALSLELVGEWPITLFALVSKRNGWDVQLRARAVQRDREAMNAVSVARNPSKTELDDQLLSSVDGQGEWESRVEAAPARLLPVSSSPIPWYAKLLSKVYVRDPDDDVATQLRPITFAFAFATAFATVAPRLAPLGVAVLFVLLGSLNLRNRLTPIRSRPHPCEFLGSVVVTSGLTIAMLNINTTAIQNQDNADELQRLHMQYTLPYSLAGLAVSLIYVLVTFLRWRKETLYLRFCVGDGIATLQRYGCAGLCYCGCCGQRRSVRWDEDSDSED